jgi:hypothetical protein
MICAISQPTFLPYLGYFELIDRADVFVLLDSVQFQRRSWQTRNRIVNPQGVPQMVNVPVQSKGLYHAPIVDIEIAVDPKWPRKTLGSISHSYGRAPHFDEQFDPLRDVLIAGHRRLADLNISLIRHFCTVLGIDTPFVRSSEIATSGSKDALLVSLCTEVGANCYYSGAMGMEYIRDKLFEKTDISISIQEYTPAPYRQVNTDEFIPFMSVVDALMCCGEEVLSIIRAGAEPAGQNRERSSVDSVA